VRVNQKLADFADAGTSWKDLGTFTLSSPLIPAVRLMRILRVLPRSGQPAERCRGRCRRSCWGCRSTRWAR
jgi:hypothetical protein